jgi:hypothetical protein
MLFWASFHFLSIAVQHRMSSDIQILCFFLFHFAFKFVGGGKEENIIENMLKRAFDEMIQQVSLTFTAISIEPAEKISILKNDGSLSRYFSIRS